MDIDTLLSDEIFENCISKIHDDGKKVIEHLKINLDGVRSGRAHPNLLSSVMITAFGTETPLKSVASISLQDSQTLSVMAWDISHIEAIKKALTTESLGLNVVSQKNTIYASVPILTQERRKDLIKIIGQFKENGRVTIRHIRNTANKILQKLDFPEDLSKKNKAIVDSVIQEYILEIDKMTEQKKNELEGG